MINRLISDYGAALHFIQALLSKKKPQLAFVNNWKAEPE